MGTVISPAYTQSYRALLLSITGPAVKRIKLNGMSLPHPVKNLQSIE